MNNRLAFMRYELENWSTTLIIIVSPVQLIFEYIYVMFDCFSNTGTCMYELK